MSDKVYIGGLGFSLSGSGGGGGAGGVHYLGAVASASALPASPSVGDMYIATASFTLNGEVVGSGDMLIWNGSSWDVIQGNIDPSTMPELSGGVLKLINSDTLASQIAEVESGLQANLATVSNAKMDKVSGVPSDNLVSFDANGNSKDSGKDATDFLPEASQMETVTFVPTLVGMEGIETSLSNI